MNATTRAIGQRFVTLLQESLTPEQFETVRTLNDSAPAGTCASHDFLDANMLMHEAYSDVTGAQMDTYVWTDADNAQWSAAWEWAVRHYLSHSEAALWLESEGWPEVTDELQRTLDALP